MAGWRNKNRCAVTQCGNLFSKTFGTYTGGVLVHFPRLLERYLSQRVASIYSRQLQLGGQPRWATNTMCCRSTTKITIMSYVMVMLM